MVGDRGFHCFPTVPDLIFNIPDRLGWSATNRENRERFYFPDASQISATVGDHSRHRKTEISTVGDVSDGFSLLPIV